ncbi:hypothetical protein DL96DRAFT_1558773 [Flagelloscypha sp. PMI_526]|nr:hypothetical protein DL96DRAFT_1558773 [Flagelloscypha sp. PMI_526]
MCLLIGVITLLLLAQAPSKVAIVGAGAGGSSASYWTKKANEVGQSFPFWVGSSYCRHSDSKPSLTLIYSRNPTTSEEVGSTVVHPYNDTSHRPVELGASIFVEANKNFWQVADEFGLVREPSCWIFEREAVY